MLISRDRATVIGHETLQAIEAGRYQAVSGAVVDIQTLLERAVEGTRSYPPDVPLPAVLPRDQPTQIKVMNETTLAVARHLVGQGLRMAVLNFASATHPGGGFLSGARAQEESLARSSGLYACLVNNPMYALHQAQQDPIYTDYIIYSPDVPVFRTDAGDWLEMPYVCSFITSAAVNAYALLETNPARCPEIPKVMKGRIDRVLTVAALHQRDVLILGAWGCGAFGNDSHQIASLFHEALVGKFRGVFSSIVFAITDWSPDSRFIGPFLELFG